MKTKISVFFGTFLLTIALGAVAQTSIHNMTDTWNDAASTFNAISMDVTDTASQDDSNFLNLLLAGSTYFRVEKSGIPMFVTL